MMLAKRSPWILVVAALFFAHAVQAIILGVAPGYSLALSALARGLIAVYLLAIWYFLGANRTIAWRLVLVLRVVALLMFILGGITFIWDTAEWWLRTWYAIVVSAILGFGWYYGIRPFFRERARFIAGDTLP